VKAQVASIDPNLPLSNVRTLDEIVAKSVSQQRFYVTLLGVFASVALVLAAIGIFGVLSYAVSQRTREIGIRMALGAREADVLRLVVGDGARLAGAGVAIGLALALVLSRVIRGMLYGVSAYDPLAWAGLTVVLALVALTASWLPARRAARIDPNLALHAD
jgi:putative ABC transport system permease protein